jgi:uncharacterized membrane protein YhhN
MTELLKKEYIRKAMDFISVNAVQTKKELKIVLPFLVPFLQTCCIHFVLGFPSNSGTILAAVVKCLPILCLMSYVSYHGFSDKRLCFYNKCILTGLAFCCVGDAFLIWQSSKRMFLAGMASFSIGHIVYLIGFGFKPFGLKELVFCLFIILAVFPSVVYPCLKGVMVPAVTFYSFLLLLGSWRALARFSLKDDEIPWRKIYAAVGTVLFVLSDTVLAVNKFCTPFSFARVIVMSLYYGAQCCIALSAVSHTLIQEREKALKELQ